MRRLIPNRAFNNLFALLAMSMVAFACTRGTGTENGGGGGGGGGPHVITDEDTTAPVIVINTPISGQVLTSGLPVNMTGRITDDMGLYQGTVKLINDATGEVLKNQAYEIHGFKLYDFSVSYVPVVTASTDMTVTVSFIDHGLNNATQSVKFKVNP